MVVTFCKAAVNTELVNTKLWGKTGLSSCEPLVTVF